MSKFIEEFYYSNIDPQARRTRQNRTVQKQMKILMLNEEFLDFVNAWSIVNGESNLDSFITYAVDTGESAWTVVDATNGIYGREVAASGDDQSFYILKGNKVTVLTTVTKADMNALTDATYPTLTFTAYAIQSANLKNGDAAVTSAADAWAVYTASTTNP